MNKLLEQYIERSKDDPEKARRDYAVCKVRGIVFEDKTTLLCCHVAGDALNVIIGYGDVNVLRDETNRIARDSHCRAIRFVSHRKGAERLAAKDGFKVIAKVFEKQIEKEGAS